MKRTAKYLRGAKKDCPHCRRTGALRIIFINGKQKEMPSTSGAVQSVWRCDACGRRTDHQ